MWLFIAFLAVPVIEIALFIQVGGLIGLGPTLAIVVLTAVLGTALVRQEGARALNDLRVAMRDLGDPTAPLAHGAMILLAGALLLTPGFFTDACGLLLLIAPVRRWVMREVGTRLRVARFEMGTGASHSDFHDARPHRPGQPPEVIDGDFIEITPENRGNQGPSGWTRH